MKCEYSRGHHLELRQPIFLHLEVFFPETERCHDLYILGWEGRGNGRGAKREEKRRKDVSKKTKA